VDSRGEARVKRRPLGHLSTTQAGGVGAQWENTSKKQACAVKKKKKKEPKKNKTKDNAPSR
jgi:hypothetical protein